MQVHVREFFVIVGQKAAVREYELKAVIEEAVFVKDQDEPG